MKRVLLLGDSIRIGYQDKVKELLKDECEVVYWEDNGRFVQYNYWQINQMFRNHGHFDIVHFNSGYWDMNIESPCEEALNPITEYLYGLSKIIKYIKDRGSIGIFATTAPIYKDGNSLDNTGTKGSISYSNEQVINYNEAALILMREQSIHVNDLYTELLKGNMYYKCDDMLHLTDEGNDVCAQKVANEIRKFL